MTWSMSSCHGQGLHSCPQRGSKWSAPPSVLGSHHSWKQPQSVSCLASSTPSSPAAFGISATEYDARMRWASNFAAFLLAERFANPVCAHTGCGASSWKDPRNIVAWPLNLNIELRSIVFSPALILSPSVSASSPASMDTQRSPTMSWFVQSICLEIQKTPSPSRDTVVNSSFSASNFASLTECFTTGLASPYIVYVSLASNVLPPSSGHCRLWTVHTSLV